MNRREKFDAASFILGGEIRNCTKTHTHTQTLTDDLAHQHVWIVIILLVVLLLSRRLCLL